MKQLFVLFLLSLCTVAASAQDVIVKKDGSTVVCRIVDVGSTVVVYKKWSDLKGDSQVINLSDISSINYESGKKEDYSEANNDYKPYNQNDGTHNYNDIYLRRIDAEMHKTTPKKTKVLRIAGIISGVVFVGAGIYFLANTDKYYFDWSTEESEWVGGVLIGVGVVSATTLCLLAEHYKKKYHREVQLSSIFQQDFKLKNGTVITPSIDMYDMCRNCRGLGVGLSYKF